MRTVLGSKAVNSDYLFLLMDDGWNESRESPLVLPRMRQGNRADEVPSTMSPSQRLLQ